MAVVGFVFWADWTSIVPTGSHRKVCLIRLIASGGGRMWAACRNETFTPLVVVCWNLENNFTSMFLCSFVCSSCCCVVYWETERRHSFNHETEVSEHPVCFLFDSMWLKHVRLFTGSKQHVCFYSLNIHFVSSAFLQFSFLSRVSASLISPEASGWLRSKLHFFPPEAQLSAARLVGGLLLPYKLLSHYFSDIRTTWKFACELLTNLHQN